MWQTFSAFCFDLCMHIVGVSEFLTLTNTTPEKTKWFPTTLMMPHCQVHKVSIHFHKDNTINQINQKRSISFDGFFHPPASPKTFTRTPVP